jgi:hypothetical protein
VRCRNARTPDIGCAAPADVFLELRVSRRGWLVDWLWLDAARKKTVDQVISIKNTHGKFVEIARGASEASVDNGGESDSGEVAAAFDIVEAGKGE